MQTNRFIAEAIGTFVMVFIGCGAIAVESIHPGTLGHTGICLAFGLAVMAMIYAVGNISGAHLNPAVTLGFFFAKRMDKRLVAGYIVSQFIGALLAASLLKFLLQDATSMGVTQPSIGLAQSFVLEVLLSFILMFVILNVSTGHMEKGVMAGVAVGGTIAMEALVGGPLTGASMNPARSFAPALISGDLTAIWLYLSAPILGTFLAQPTCRWIQGDDCCPAEFTEEAS